MNGKLASRFVNGVWDGSILPQLIDYIRIPNKSPLFDPAWEANGHMEAVVAQFVAWAREQPIDGLSLEVIRLPGRTPLIYMDIPGEPGDCVLLYGHLDKQPEMTGWRAGLGPWVPVLDGDRLYGRGGADDGYAMFASLTAVAALQAQKVPHARCVVIIEACEESGSYDLPHYIEALGPRIGNPSLVICLDSGCGNYEQLWCTTSLRGLAGGVLSVDVLTEGVHSGDASGIVPSAVRVLRGLLSRIEDEGSGRILPEAFNTPIPPERVEQARVAAGVLGAETHRKFPFLPGVAPGDDDPAELILNRTWRPALSVTGAGGLPPIRDAGNVTLPGVSAKLSLRLPPNCDGERAVEAVRELMERNPPYGARVRFQAEWAATGWDAPSLAPWLADSLSAASTEHFGKPVVYMGEGGTIPFMAMLGERFPDAQFVITGVLGPHSNAHGPNEFLHLPTARRLTACVARVLADHLARHEGGARRAA